MNGAIDFEKIDRIYTDLEQRFRKEHRAEFGTSINDIDFSPTTQGIHDAQLLEFWKKRIPRPVDDAVKMHTYTLVAHRILNLDDKIKDAVK